MTFELVCEGCMHVYEIDEERAGGGEGGGSWSLEDILGSVSPCHHGMPREAESSVELRFRTGNTFRMVERKVHRGNVRKES